MKLFAFLAGLVLGLIMFPVGGLAPTLLIGAASGLILALLLKTDTAIRVVIGFAAGQLVIGLAVVLWLLPAGHLGQALALAAYVGVAMALAACFGAFIGNLIRIFVLLLIERCRRK